MPGTKRKSDGRDDRCSKRKITAKYISQNAGTQTFLSSFFATNVTTTPLPVWLVSSMRLTVLISGC
jgi:hypothetical protein